MKQILSSTLLYGIIGPPIGGFALLAWVALTAPYAESTLGTFAVTRKFFELSGLVLMFSYLAGGIQALSVGFMVGLIEWWIGNRKIFIPIAVALGASAFFVALMVNFSPLSLTIETKLHFALITFSTLAVYFIKSAWLKYQT